MAGGSEDGYRVGLHGSWVLGYTADYTLGFGVGNDDDSPMRNMEGVAGAGPIWYHEMLDAERGHPRTPFAPRPGVRLASYCSGGICSMDVFLTDQALPSGIGDTGPAQLPRIALNPSGGWHFSTPPDCERRLVG